MPMISRLNNFGLTFHVQALDNNSSEIIDIRNNNRIVINHSIEEISQMWYNWQVKGEYIQKAFASFTPEQREFIMTGITPKEWNELFSEKE